MNFNVMVNLVHLCTTKGIRHVVICPGSRSAPLTLAFTRNRNLKCWTFSDERSAAFIAMAMAQEMRGPVVLVCTSGSAAYNFAPAVAESYFQQIPLIVLTADRPKEWIDQWDGQTIRQTELYGKHVKKYYELPQEYTHHDSEWYANRIFNEAINLSQSGRKGPVHINSPFREPLYPALTDRKDSSGTVRNIEKIDGENTVSETTWSDLLRSISSFNKILVVSGQNEKNDELNKVLEDVHTFFPWPLAGDILGNLHSLPFFSSHGDAFLGQLPSAKKELLQPDLLITFGKSLVAKNLKLFLRTHPPKEHWHLEASGKAADTFQSLTKIIPLSPLHFFTHLRKRTLAKQESWVKYGTQWEQYEEKAKKTIRSFFQSKQEGEFLLVKRVLESLPDRSNLHLANSMAVRYANHIGLTGAQKNVSVFSNRGTSGIDGCSSTAVGHALTSSVPNVLITGDQAFFYDRNAFWHNYSLSNLFIVVLNNHGGIIFNLIDGPAGLPETEEFFITRQRLNAKSLASEFGYTYADASAVDLKTFFKSNGNAKVLEIDSSQSQNKDLFEEFKKQIKKSYEA